MAEIKDNRTTFQKLTDVVIGLNANSKPALTTQSVTYNMTPKDTVLYTFNSKEERDLKAAQLKQQRLLTYQWKKSGYETSMEHLPGAAQVKVMYRDADLMAQWPEIGRALEIISEEATTLKKGKMLNIYSKSPRIKSILEDLFVNRLNIHTILPEIFFDTCKYGNDFRLLNINGDEGVLGWRKLPTHQMVRLENGLQNVYGGATMNANLYNLKPDETKFIWEGHNEQIPFLNWQVAHFRLIRDSIFLPYGVSIMNSARRFWRILSMMEDAMLLHRIEKSIERRIYKVNVGAMDQADVQTFLDEFANTFKRAPIVDPKTGQIDLRKNFLDVNTDYFIPVRDGQDPTSIEVLQGLNSQLQMEDVQYMQNKLLTAMGVPKNFLNYQDSSGKQQNLSIQDIRFCRSVNYYQQVILMELNKIAIIHLYLLGFYEDLTNFTLSLNNPSNQVEMMELDNMTKRLTNAATALAEQGGGIPLMSWHQVQKEIMGRTDAEIAATLDEIRLEKAIAAELMLTSQIIKKTNVFDKIDRIYGEPGAQYDFSALQPDGGGGLGGGGGAAPPMGGGGFGDDLGDLGAPGGEDIGDLGGEEGATDLDNLDADTTQPMESVNRRDSKLLINERLNRMLDNYIEKVLHRESVLSVQPSGLNDNFITNEGFRDTINELQKFSEKTTELDNLLD